MNTTNDPGDMRCPRCGDGVVTDIAFDEAAPSGARVQEPQARQITTFSCGHVQVGLPLASADADRLDVERRTPEETVTPPTDPAP